MGFLDLAKQIELQSKAHYLRMVEMGPAQLKGIFQLLANEEQNHYELFCSMENGKCDGKIEDGKLKEKVTLAFNEISRNFSDLDPMANTESVYWKACFFENESINYYQQMLPNIAVEEKSTMEFIINQEKIHARLMDNLVLLVQSPEVWLENAEWNNLDDAY